MSSQDPIPLRVLAVEDSEDDAFLLRRQLQNAGYRVELGRVDTHTALQNALRQEHWDIVFSDFSMPQFDGMQALKVVREHDRDLPFIIVSGTIGEERAVQLMKWGAQDYVIKGNIKRLIPAVERELKEARLRREHRLAQEHIQRLAYYDSLTQLPNRHRLVGDLQHWLDRGESVALMIVNLINFHEINEILGYSTGDELIREAAIRLQGVTLDNPSLYHLHGNEFALLIQINERAEVEAAALEILKVLGPPYPAAGLRVHIGARIGIALSSGHTEAHAFLQSGDTAATLARRQGKAYAWSEPERDSSRSQRLAILADLHDALSTDQLFMAFQPKVDCRTGAVTSAEALLRWKHPKQGFIPPDVFIGMAERSGLIDDLTRHVVTRVIDQTNQWRKKNLRIPVAINLSVRNLLNAPLMSEILQATLQEQEAGGKIEIEITETALMQDRASAMTVLRRLYDSGVRIYIDDFGTGFSSLGYLTKLPIHAIKIDKSFVLDLVQNRDSDAIVRSTISLAHNLGLKVVAEGVESGEAWEQLKRYNCDEGQGYHFMKPLPAAEFEAAMATWTSKHK
jgi:diguanylate cyclase